MPMSNTDIKNDKKKNETKIKKETIIWYTVEVLQNNTLISWKFYSKWDKLRVEILKGLEPFTKII